MTEEELREIEHLFNQDADGDEWADIYCQGQSHQPYHVRRLIAEIRDLRKGEFVCRKCWLRKDAEPIAADF